MAGQNVLKYIADPEVARKVLELIQTGHSVCQFLDKHKEHLGGCPASEIDPAGGSRAAYCRCGLSEFYDSLNKLRIAIGEDPEDW